MIVGLDGAALALLSHLTARGVLPALARMMAGGVHAPLLSTIPPFTGPAWTSIVTGVNPGRHGVYGFGTLDAATGELALTRTEQIGFPRLWQVANAHGLTAGVVNVPSIYPPDPVDGFMLSGMLTPPGAGDFAFPAAAATVVHEALGQAYQVDVSVSPGHDEQDGEVLSRLTRLLRQRERAVHALLDRGEPDLLMVVLVVPDRLQHLYWGYLVPSGPDDPVYHAPGAEAFRAKLEALYAEVDGVVGRLLERAGPSCRTFVVSDHGFARYEREIKINNWLLERGWLALRAGGGAVRSLRGALGSVPGVRRLAGRLYRSRAGRSVRRGFIDFPRTQAYAGAVFQQGIYVNLEGRQARGCVPGTAYESLRQEIVDGLVELRDPATGECLFERVYVREEAFHGPYLERAPDILPVVRGGNGLITPGFGEGELVFDHSAGPLGCHHPEGTFIACGPGVRRGVRLPAARVVDIVPTVLHGLGLAIPRDLDGEVLAGVWEPGEWAANPPRVDERRASEVVPVSMQPAQAGFDFVGDEALIKERLEGLGYL